MERVLVCVVNSTRGHEVTFPGFKRHVLDELNADLALAIAVPKNDDRGDPFWHHAKYRWIVDRDSDFAEAFDAAQRTLCQRDNLEAPDWRMMLAIEGNWLGWLGSPQPSLRACGLQQFCRWLLLQGLQADALLDRYDRFIITRSDFAWLGPHPPLSVLDPGGIWIPDGEDYEGLADRHLVVSRTDVVDCLNLIEAVLLRPIELYEEMKHSDYWNSEQYFLHHMSSRQLLHKVRRFPKIAYLARDKRDNSPTWSRGTYNADLGHFVKYDEEFASANAIAAIIHSRADWERGEWRQFDAAAVVPGPFSFKSRLIDAWYQILWALHRPGRVRRFLRLCQRTIHWRPET